VGANLGKLCGPFWIGADAASFFSIDDVLASVVTRLTITARSGDSDAAAGQGLRRECAAQGRAEPQESDLKVPRECCIARYSTGGELLT